MKMYSKYPHEHIKRGECFTVERAPGCYQAVYPEALAERYAGTYPTEKHAWDAIKEDCEIEGITLVEEDDSEPHLRSFP